jgi:C_GCAxxG_C_C family probable redox protein
LGRTGATCGAVTGAIMVLGLRFGSADPDREARQAVYLKVQELLARFQALHGSTVCRELLGCDIRTDEGLQRARDLGLFQQRCPRYVEDATRLAGELGAMP